MRLALGLKNGQSGIRVRRVDPSSAANKAGGHFRGLLRRALSSLEANNNLISGCLALAPLH